MTTMVQDKIHARARTRWLRAAAGSERGGAGSERGGAGRERGAAGLLLLDTGAAIGFAGALAGGVVAVPHGVATVVPWALLAVAAGAERGCLAMAAIQVGARGAAAAKHRQRGLVVAAALHRAPDRPIGDGGFAHLAVDAVEALDGHVARFLPAHRASSIAPLIVLLATACASWVATAILALTLIPFIAAMALAGGAAADESRRQFAALARLSGRFADRIRALPVVLAFRAEDREAVAIGTAADDLARRTIRVLRVAFLSSASLEFFAALSVALVAVYCGFALLGLLPFTAPETLTLGQAFFVLALAPEFYAPMRRLAAAYHDKQAAETAADALMAMPEPVSRAPIGSTSGTLTLRDVSIRYPGSDHPAVSRLSLTIVPGETVALLGPSGSGKTSVLHLLLGLAPLTAGSMTLDGEPLDTLAGRASWAGQHPLLIPGTIRENLLLAHPTATEAALHAAIDAAGLGPMLAHRARGLDAPLDARGGGLSGGERRRLSLARALLKPAPFLLLDEPTAHLDADAEAALIATIARAMTGRTTLIATHSAALAAIATRTVHLGETA